MMAESGFPPGTWEEMPVKSVIKIVEDRVRWRESELEFRKQLIKAIYKTASAR